jgi:hypothetical protein
MTEKQWLSAANLKLPLKHLATQSERKRRLLAVASCARVAHLVPDKRATRVLSCIERYADGLVGDSEINKAESLAFRLFDELRGTDADDDTLTPAAAAAEAILFAVNGGVMRGDPAGLASHAAAEAVGIAAARGKQAAARAAEVGAQLKLLGEIFGNPFRSVAVDPAWRTSTVMALASGIYEERAFERLPILADALQDAGCDADAILDHFRDPAATHVRGCWALDLVLGKG